MSFFLENWGGITSALGVLVTIVGVIVSFAAFRRAGKAQEAATSAQSATQETRAAMTKVLSVVDLERAIALIQRVKVLHRNNRWEASSEHYQDLRQMLADIESRYPSHSSEVSSDLRTAIGQIRVIEDNVDRGIQDEKEPTGSRNFNRELNSIQEKLEEMVSSTHFIEG